MRVAGIVVKQVLVLGETLVVSLEREDGTLVGTHCAVTQAALERVRDGLDQLTLSWESHAAKIGASVN